MPDDDKVFVERVAAEKAANTPPVEPGFSSLAQSMRQYANRNNGMREVGDDELECCQRVLKNQRAYEQQQVDEKRVKMLLTIQRVGGLIKTNFDDDDERQVEWQSELLEILKKVRAATTIAQIDECWRVDEVAGAVDWELLPEEERQRRGEFF
jgi:hypothetical protein